MEMADEQGFTVCAWWCVLYSEVLAASDWVPTHGTGEPLGAH